MKKILRMLPVLLLAGGVLNLSPMAVAAEVSYENPVIAGDHPDPSIIHVGKDYWASCTSSEWGPLFPILHSRDLVNWKQVSAVFYHRPDWAVGNFWAPEIYFYKGRYFVYYVGREKNGPLAVAVATADKAEGPYTDHGPIIAQPHGSIDPVPCENEKGESYLVWKDDNNSVNQTTTIWAQPLNADGTQLTGEPTALIHNDTDWEGAVVEGPYILRRGDWFYLFYSGSGCCGQGCKYALGVARSHSLLGPCEKNLQNPILKGNDRWRCPGHGSIVPDDQGRYWLLYHAYSVHSDVYTGREAMLDEVTFEADGWPTINHGNGPTIRAASPYGAIQKTNDLSFADDFAGHSLKPGWQWPQHHEPKLSFQHHQLILSGKAEHGPNTLAAVLAHSTITADYIATTVIDTTHLQSGCSAGLSAFGDFKNAIGLSVGDGRLTLWQREHGEYKSLANVACPPGKKLHLRLMVNNGFQFHFAAGADGKTWTPVGDDLTGKTLPPWDRSVRVALTTEGTGAAEARFDSFRLTPAAAAK